jgi:hypothetical protein
LENEIPEQNKTFDIRKDYFKKMNLHKEMLKMRELIKHKINADEVRVSSL